MLWLVKTCYSYVDPHRQAARLGFKLLRANFFLFSSFLAYGTVVELRINSGGKLPNFGFVVFDDAEPVQKILSSRVRHGYVTLVYAKKVFFW